MIELPVVLAVRCRDAGRETGRGSVQLFWHLSDRCKRNGKVYIGSAENCFELTIVELVEDAALLRVEQRWIQDTGRTSRRLGFNVKLEATSGGLGVGRTWVAFATHEAIPSPSSTCPSFAGAMDWTPDQCSDSSMAIPS